MHEHLCQCGHTGDRHPVAPTGDRPCLYGSCHCTTWAPEHLPLRDALAVFHAGDGPAAPSVPVPPTSPAPGPGQLVFTWPDRAPRARRRRRRGSGSAETAAAALAAVWGVLVVALVLVVARLSPAHPGELVP